MIDVLCPCPFANLSLAPNAIESVAAMTDVPIRVVVVVDGGARPDLQELETFLAGFDHPWKLLHNAPAVGLNQTLREGLEECVAKLTLLMGPEIRIDDDLWFGKVQAIFHRDPICGIVDTWPKTGSSTLMPVRRQQNRPADPGCRLAMLQTAYARKTPPFGAVDPVQFWSRTVMQQGGSSWAAPGVRYFEAEHAEHELGSAPLARRG